MALGHHRAHHFVVQVSRSVSASVSASASVSVFVFLALPTDKYSIIYAQVLLLTSGVSIKFPG